MKWYKKQMDALKVSKGPAQPSKGPATKRTGHTGLRKNSHMQSVPSPVAASKLQRKKTDSI